MDAPSTREWIALQFETRDGPDVSDEGLLPLCVAAQDVTPHASQQANDASSASMTSLPYDVILLVSQLLDWRDSVRLGSTCVVVGRAMEGLLSLYSDIARWADAIHRGEGDRWLLQFSTAMREIDALPWASRPSALQLFVQRISHRERGFHATFLGASACVSEAVSVWRTRMLALGHDDGHVDRLAARAHWAETEAAIKMQVQIIPSGALRDASLRQLCHAKAYLPWLGLVLDPRKHLSYILEDIANLPYSDWAGVLCVFCPLIGVRLFPRLNQVFHEFSTRVQEVHAPIPRLLLVDVLSHLTGVGQPGLARSALHTRFAVSAERDLQGIIEAVAQNIVDAALSKHLTRTGYVDEGPRTPSTALLRRLTGWDIDDPMLAKQVNRCFIGGIAAQPSRFSVDWSSQPLTIRRHAEGDVLGVPVETVEGWGCSRAIIVQFWPVFLDITGAPGFIRMTALWQKVLSAPWQLQGVLLYEVWKRYVSRSVDFDGEFASHMSPRCIEWEGELSAQALAAAQPALALRGILASVQWQAGCANELSGQWINHEPRDGDAVRPIFPVISSPGIRVIGATSPAMRMELIAALSAMRRSLIDAGYSWCFDTLVFDTLRGVLCDPTVSLSKPSRNVAYAIADVIASVWPFISDVGDAYVSRFDRLAARLDLQGEVREHVWGRVLTHLTLRIQSNDRTFDETIRQGDASTPAERRLLMQQLSRASN